MASVSLFCAFRRFVSRTVKMRRIHECFWTHRIRTSGGKASLFFTVTPLSYLIYERINHFTTVCALDTAEEVLEHSDYLYSSGETQKLHQLLVQYKDSDDAEFLWRLARASRDLSLLSSITTEDKKRLTYEAFDFAKRALEKNESSFAAHKWYAICLSDVGDYEGIKVKIGNSYIIKDHLQRAIELNPKDATSIHILGYWCFAFAELPWYQRKVAAVIFASPPTATYEEALAYFLKAEEVEPNFYSKNLLMLGKTYMMLSDREKAVLWLNKAHDYPAVTEEDKQVHKDALDLLKKLNA
ncbi:regulator of microtubule dynamics protein 1 [Myxocyprinus asiaticus]|uniref:regulator of microtubule dynamics protein 1 n=1 Tax=Myxocyprinus asiaticus TaxID=70543 RepID=UPI002223DD77|nr:regulator of microtubule dynamics protein 1 [Myxocyprinus asiaticus]